MNFFDDVEAEYEHALSVTDIKSAILIKLPWLAHSTFNIGDHVGYNGTFGASDTSKCDVFCALHELSHAVELTRLNSRIWKRRLGRHDFELRVRTAFWVFGVFCREPKTLQISDREAVVGGIQLRLLEAMGYDVSTFVPRYAMLMSRLADNYLGPGTAPYNASAAQHSPEHLAWLNGRAAMVQKAYQDWPLDRIQRAWAAVASHMLVIANRLARNSPAQDGFAIPLVT